MTTPGEPRWARWQVLGAVVGAVAVLAATGCGSSSSSSSGDSSNPLPSTVDKTPVTLTLWHMFAGEEAAPFNAALARFHQKYPWITIKPEVQPNTDDDTFDPNLINAINGGNAPDVAMPFGPDYAGQYCSSGLMENLDPVHEAGPHLDLDQFSKAALTYTNYGGNQCLLPSLTDAYGLYYNNAMLQQAGITSPPKTMDELMADAKKLTVRNSDGSIKVAGFSPMNEFNELGLADLARAWGGEWFDSNGKAQLATDPAWTKALMWQKQLIDWYGYNNIAQVRRRPTPTTEFNAGQAFQTGKLAMAFDGEWRTAFIRRTAKDLPLRHRAVPGRGRRNGTARAAWVAP